MELLVIEDEKAIRNLIATTLELNNYKFHVAQTANEGISQFLTHPISLILLDLGLPDMDGIEVIKKIRGFSEVPIIIISARSDDKDKVEALDEGADDYLVKPFSVDELLARIRVALRRVSGDSIQKETNFINGNLEIHYDAQSLEVNHVEVHLTPLEYKLLCVLAKNIGKVLSYRYILREVWGTVLEDDTKSLRVFMTSLRKKLDQAGCKREIIQTHVGIGYRMTHLDKL